LSVGGGVLLVCEESAGLGFRAVGLWLVLVVLVPGAFSEVDVWTLADSRSDGPVEDGPLELKEESLCWWSES
jgi:hypothetical protein